MIKQRFSTLNKKKSQKTTDYVEDNRLYVTNSNQRIQSFFRSLFSNDLRFLPTVYANIFWWSVPSRNIFCGRLAGNYIVFRLKPVCLKTNKNDRVLTTCCFPWWNKPSGVWSKKIVEIRVSVPKRNPDNGDNHCEVTVARWSGSTLV